MAKGEITTESRIKHNISNRGEQEIKRNIPFAIKLHLHPLSAAELPQKTREDGPTAAPYLFIYFKLKNKDTNSWLALEV